MADHADSRMKFIAQAADLLGIDAAAFGVDGSEALLRRCLDATKSAVSLNRVAEAVALFRSAAQLAPDNDAVQWAAAEYILRHGTPREAEEHMRVTRDAGRLGALPSFALDVRARFEAIVVQAYDRTVRPPSAGLIIAIAVWGERFADVLVRYSLPQVLGQQSLDTVAARSHARLMIFADTADAERIGASAVFKALQQKLAVQFVDLPGEWTALAGERLVNFQLLALCHYAAIEAARRAEARVAFFFPDILCNESYLAHAWNAAEAGGAVVLAAALRGGEALLREIERARAIDGAIRIDAARLGALAARSLDARWFADGGRTVKHPFHLLWRAGAAGCLGRITHPTPIMFDGAAVAGPLAVGIEPIDGAFLNRWLKPEALRKIVRAEAGQILLVGAESTPLVGEAGGCDAKPFDEFRYAEFLAEFDTPVMRDNLETAYRIGSATDAEWETAARESLIATEAALALVDTFRATAEPRPGWATRRADSN